ncbi:regulator of chromosome condensation 1/beta-lactamase-inhibitor protein II [Lentinula edodes]|nr:regulator of chromosome condensation 1/beta-lactamase-inhibitor protein II [Lentinula edodes]
MLSIIDIPLEIFLDNLLPRLPLVDLLQLQSTNKFFAQLCGDETFWKKKLAQDFNFPDESTARRSGWKFIYLRLTKPRVFVWGRKEHGRLGITSFPKSTLNNVSSPLELKFPGARIVNLAAGGMSFQALDSEGCIHVWGALDGSQLALNRDGFSEPGKIATTPLRLQLPTSIRSISCGRLHSSSLDFNNQIWTFLSWGRPFRLVSDLLGAPDFTPIQVECGWTFSSALMKSGDVVVWWPFSDPLRTVIETRMAEMDNQVENCAHPTNDGLIMCAPWELQTDPVVLPSLPSLPKLFGAEPDSDTPRIVKIAGFDNAMIALTNQGHVLLFDTLQSASEPSLGSWKYLPNFSEASRIQNHHAFSNAKLKGPPSDSKITHISAHFRTFIAYSESIVLMGDTETNPDTLPKIIPGLQDKSIISVVLGDYHFAAVTATGKLLTWGQYSDGALGLGDPGSLQAGTPGGFANETLRVHALETRRGTPPDVEIPTEVRFDSHRKKAKDRFCVSAAASGWHTGALVIDLETNENQDDSDVEIEKELAQPSRMRRHHGAGAGRGQFETPPILPGGIPTQDPGLPFIGRGGGIFRVGFAGRGIPRGRGT